MLLVIRQAHNRKICLRAVLIVIVMFGVVAIVGANQTPSEAVQLRQAARHVQKDELDKAEQILQKLLRQRSDSSEAFELLGLVRMKQQRFDEAESFFLRAIRINPRLANAHINLGHLYKQSNRLELARQSFQNAAGILPRNAAVLYNLALVLADLRQFDKAIDTLKAIPATERPPDYSELLARFYITAGDFVKGEESLRELLLQKPDSISTLRQLAGGALKRGDAKSAWQYMAQARQLAPNSPDLLYEFAQVSLRNNLGQEAVIAMRKALLLEPDRPEFLFCLGDALLNTPNFHDAAGYLERYL